MNTGTDQIHVTFLESRTQATITWLAHSFSLSSVTQPSSGSQTAQKVYRG